MVKNVINRFFIQKTKYGELLDKKDNALTMFTICNVALLMKNYHINSYQIQKYRFLKYITI